MKITNGAAIFAAVVGVFQVVGSLTGITFFSAVGRTLAISPAPSPYALFSQSMSSVGGGPYFGCQTSSDVAWHQLNYQAVGRIPGPHRRIVPMLNLFSIMGYLSRDADRKPLEKLARYYFCHGGPMARAGDCSADPDSILFGTPNPTTGQMKPYVKVSCRNN